MSKQAAEFCARDGRTKAEVKAFFVRMIRPGGSLLPEKF
jgi:hypothetical protein